MSQNNYTLGAVAQAANDTARPLINNIFGVSAEFLGELKTWFEQNPPAIPVSQIVGYQANSQSSRVYLNVAQSVASSGTASKLNFDTVDFDYGGLWDSTNHRFTITLAGKYIINAGCIWNFSGTGNRIIYLKKNGSTYVASNGISAAGSSFTTDLSVSDILDLAADDYLEAWVAQDSGGALNVLNDLRTHMSIARVGA